MISIPQNIFSITLTELIMWFLLKSLVEFIQMWAKNTKCLEKRKGENSTFWMLQCFKHFKFLTVFKIYDCNLKKKTLINNLRHYFQLRRFFGARLF